jgi:hypothetical protein
MQPSGSNQSKFALRGGFFQMSSRRPIDSVVPIRLHEKPMRQLHIFHTGHRNVLFVSHLARKAVATQIEGGKLVHFDLPLMQWSS